MVNKNGTANNPKDSIKRLFGYIFKHYMIHCIAVLMLIILSSLANVAGTMFMKNLIDDYIVPFIGKQNPDFSLLMYALIIMAFIYYGGALATWGYNRIMINVAQGTLRNIRNDIFSHMESLPIKYFDTHAHGDIMSVYTNDTDTLRQMISQSLPQLVSSGITVVSVFAAMLILNIPLTMVTLLMVGVMLFVQKKWLQKAASISWPSSETSVQLTDTSRK